MTTRIQWTEETWNPTTGCDRISEGCDQWKRPRTIFVNSMSDLFHADVPDDFIAAVVQVMTFANQHTYQVLTKRPQRMPKVLSRISWDLGGDSSLGTFTADELGMPNEPAYDFAVNLPNVWWGTTIEHDKYSFRARYLRETPAAVRFLSLEPLIGPLPSLDLTGIDWAIVGCESGHGARPFNLDWARDLRDRCAESGTAFFVKQLPGSRGVLHDLDDFPDDLRIREYPQAPSLIPQNHPSVQALSDPERTH